MPCISPSVLQGEAIGGATARDEEERDGVQQVGRPYLVVIAQLGSRQALVLRYLRFPPTQSQLPGSS